MKTPFSTRQWKHSEGYKYLACWTNAVLLRFLIRKLTAGFPNSEYRRKNQLDDAARSVVANIEEGYKRPTTKEYLDFLGFSQGSLEEIKGDIKRVYQDGFLKSKPGSNLIDLKINLEEVKGLLKDSKGIISLETLYSPLKLLKGSELSFEIFMELINKTDYLLRQLVSSLEKKLVNPSVLKKKYQQESDDFDEELKRIVEKGRKEKGY